MQSQSTLVQILRNRYGEIIGGSDLWRELGMRTPDAMRSAIRRGRLPVKTFRMEGRRGVFALSRDVADHLMQEINKAMP